MRTNEAKISDILLQILPKIIYVYLMSQNLIRAKYSVLPILAAVGQNDFGLTFTL